MQIEAIQKILTLTFEAEGGVEKFLETVTQMLSGNADLLAKLSP